MTDYYILAFWLIIGIGALVTLVTILLTGYLAANSKKQPLDMLTSKEKAQSLEIKNYLIMISIYAIIAGFLFSANTWSGIQYEKQQALHIRTTQQILLTTLAEVKAQQQQYFAMYNEYAPNLQTLSMPIPTDLTLYYRVTTGYIQNDKQRFYIMAYPVNKHFMEHLCKSYLWLDNNAQYNIAGDYSFLSQPRFWDNLDMRSIASCWEISAL